MLALQQSTSEPRAGQLLYPQKRLLWHSLLESQSPWSSAHGFEVVQKSSCPILNVVVGAVVVVAVVVVGPVVVGADVVVGGASP